MTASEHFKEDVLAILSPAVPGEAALETPPPEIPVDLAFPCFSLAKAQKKSPVQITQKSLPSRTLAHIPAGTLPSAAPIKKA